MQTTKEALSNLESGIAETYLEHKGDPLVGTIEPSMYMGRHKIDPDAVVDDARPYVYEIINNLIAVHAEVSLILVVIYGSLKLMIIRILSFIIFITKLYLKE